MNEIKAFEENNLTLMNDFMPIRACSPFLRNDVRYCLFIELLERETL